MRSTLWTQRLAVALTAISIETNEAFRLQRETSRWISDRLQPLPVSRQMTQHFFGASLCQPGEACWPTDAEWAVFNISVNGRLLNPLPEARPCVYAPQSSECAAVAANWTDELWRATLPGASQYVLWEADQQTGANCYTVGQPCEQGNIPPFGVAAQGADDVAASVVFAAKHNMRVVVKASGHDLQGRSAGKDGLLVWLHRLNAYVVHDRFAACPGDIPTAAVTAQSGVGGGTLQAALGANYTLVTGSARSVSAAGGHMLGGGHSFASPAYGLAVDNVLAAQVVLANGSVVTVSKCSHADLFWALRGGGGSTFGVVINATHRLHPLPPQGVTGLDFGVGLTQGLGSVAAFLDLWFAFSPKLLDPATAGGSVWGGYWYVQPNDPGPYAFLAVFAYNGTQAAAEASFAPLIAAVLAESEAFQLLGATFTPYPSMNAWHEAVDPAPGETTGSVCLYSSRLVPRAAAADPTRRANVSLAITSMAQYMRILGHLVAGGAVAAADPGHKFTSVTPAWRTAVAHVVGQVGLPLNSTYEYITGAFSALSSLTQPLRDATAESGAYWNEADYLEPLWQSSFWGTNYPLLQSVKRLYDPNGIFGCWHCVELPVDG